MAALDLPLLMPAIRLDQEAGREAARALERAPRRWVAGFLLFGGEADEVAALAARLRERAEGPLLLAADLERGAGQQVRGLGHLPDAGLFGLAATPEEVRLAGEATARQARSVGVDLVFAPVLDVRSEPDNPIVGNRAFGWDPARVATLGAAFCDGVLHGGALPVAKHFPGHGATRLDSHTDVPVVTESARRLLARDLPPFLAAIARGCPAIMTAHVAYPELDSRGVIATFSRPILDPARRAAPDPDDLAIVTDALCMEGACGGIGEVDAARRALAAGCDLLLYPEDPEAVAQGLLDGVQGRSLGERAERAAVRVRSLLARAAVAAAEARAAPSRDVDLGFADEVAVRAVDMAGVQGPERDWILVLDDDDVEGRGQVLAEAGRARGVPVGVVRLPRGERPPPESPVAGGWTVVVMAQVRASKGAAGVTPACREVVRSLQAAARGRGRRMDLVWCGPRAEDGVGCVLPGTGEAVERALAARLLPPGSADDPGRAPS